MQVPLKALYLGAFHEYSRLQGPDPDTIRSLKRDIMCQVSVHGNKETFYGPGCSGKHNYYSRPNIYTLNSSIGLYQNTCIAYQLLNN